MDCGTYYNPNSNNSSSSSTPILIPSSCSRRATNSTRNAKNNKKKAAAATGGGVRLSTDPQSVAARERRHKISDRFKMLQSLVPGGAKLDTVSMLEQAIQYVKFLKAQIWLHEALIKNNNNVSNNNIINTTTTTFNNNQDYHYDNHSFISTTTINNDAYDYDHQYCYTLMYDCNNKNIIDNHHEGGGGGVGGASVGVIQGGFRNPQEINNMVAATTSYRAIQVSSDGCSFHHGHGQQSM